MIIDRTAMRARIGPVLVVVALTLSCDDKALTNSVPGNGGGSGGNGGNGPTTPATTRRVVGVAEVTFSDVTSATISSTILLATSVADLERLRTAGTRVSNVTSVLVQTITTGEFTITPPGESKARFIRATFGVQNARTDSALFDPSRENLTFVALRTSSTLPNTAVRTFQRADGSPANSALALQLIPTALSAADADGSLVTIAADNLRGLSTDDMTKLTLPSGAAGVFPYSFVIRRFPSIAGGPSFDGVVTFAYRLPDEDNAQDDPDTISVLFLVIDDPNAPRTTP